MNYQVSEKKKDYLVFFIFVLVFVFIGSIAVYGYWLSTKAEKYDLVQSSVPSIAITPTLESTVVVTPTVQDVAYKVSVLNGSGVDGLAGKAKIEIGKKLPLSVVTTGNASSVTGVKLIYKDQSLVGTKLDMVAKELWAGQE